MFKRLFNIFKAENDRSQLIILIVIAVIVQLVFTSLLNAIMNSIFQFIISWIASYASTRFFNKYYEFTQIQWWKRFYMFMIAAAIVMYVIS